jgi:hypothetical protein
MKTYKIVIILIAAAIVSYYGIGKSYGNLGGPGQNMCYHNNTFYTAIGSANSIDCPDPGADAHQSANPPHTNVSDPECLLEIRPLL